MATTLTYGDYLKLIRGHVSASTLENHGPQIVNMAVRKVWARYPWRAFIQDFRPFHLIPLEQDYGPPFNAVPADFDSFINANLVFLANGGNALRYPPLKVKQFLETTSRRGIPEDIAFYPGRPGRGSDTGNSAQFRLFPRPNESMGAPQWFVEGRYKRTPQKIDNSLIENPLPFDDKYESQIFDVFVWAGKKLGGAQDTGQVQFQDGMERYTGHLASAMQAIEEMARFEGFSDGDTTLAPSEPLDGSTVYGSATSLPYLL